MAHVRLLDALAFHHVPYTPCTPHSTSVPRYTSYCTVLSIAVCSPWYVSHGAAQHGQLLSLQAASCVHSSQQTCKCSSSSKRQLRPCCACSEHASESNSCKQQQCAAAGTAQHRQLLSLQAATCAYSSNNCEVGTCDAVNLVESVAQDVTASCSW